MPTKKLSAIIPCYKEAENIPVLYQKLTDIFHKIHVDYEIIFVNDGSPDNTEQILQDLVKKDPHIIGVNHSRNFNSQMAYTSGMEIATGDAVVLLDGDLQDPPELIGDFYSKWLEGYDVVYGVRKKREGPLYLRFFYNLFYIIFRKLSDVSMPLYAGDFSLVDRRVVDILRQFPERDRFLRGLRAWVGFKQIGVSYIRPKRMFGRTNSNLAKNFDWAAKGIFSFSLVPLRLMTFLSLVVFMISLASIFIEIVLKIFVPDVPRGFTTFIVVVLFLGSIQLLCLSVIGEYIAKIFEEVKQRPRYIVKSIVRNSDRESSTP